MDEDIIRQEGSLPPIDDQDFYVERMQSLFRDTLDFALGDAEINGHRIIREIDMLSPGNKVYRNTQENLKYIVEIIMSNDLAWFSDSVVERLKFLARRYHTLKLPFYLNDESVAKIVQAEQNIQKSVLDYQNMCFKMFDAENKSRPDYEPEVNPLMDTEVREIDFSAQVEDYYKVRPQPPVLKMSDYDQLLYLKMSPNDQSDYLTNYRRKKETKNE